MPPLETPRLTLRRLTRDDAPFILRLLNEKSWLRYIGDRGVRNESDAKRYIEEGPVRMYSRYGLGLQLAALKESGVPIGLCGLIKRDTLPDVDLGFALLPEYWGKGYAREAAEASLNEGWERHGLRRVVAVTSRDNGPSIRLLEKLGFRLEGVTRLGKDPEPLNLFAIERRTP